MEQPFDMFNNLLMWDARMRNPKELKPEEQRIVDMCEYLKCIRYYSINNNFSEYHEKQQLVRSFGHSCDISCVCYNVPVFES